VGEYRRATAWINDKTFALRGLQTDMARVTCFRSEQIDSRMHRIATALAKRIEDLERAANRNATLLQRLQTLSADALSKRLDQIEEQIERVSKTARYVRANKRSK
jgi:hypothetical protein